MEQYKRIAYKEIVKSEYYLTQDPFLMLHFSKSGIPLRVVCDTGKYKHDPICGYDNDETTANAITEYEKKKRK